MIQTRNQYLQFMLVMLAAWGISWGARFVMEQAVLLYGSGKNYLFFSHGTVLMYLLCVFLVYRRWIAPLPVVGQLRNVGVPWLVGDGYGTPTLRSWPTTGSGAIQRRCPQENTQQVHQNRP